MNYSGINNNAYKHGMWGTRFYCTWKGMRGRCNTKGNSGYWKYGAKGITVNSEWDNFIDFMNDMYDDYLEHSKKHGEKNTFLDRINKSMLKNGYSKKNCRWTTKEIQLGNRHKKNGTKYNKVKKIFYGFERLTIRELSKKTGISVGAIHYRIKNKLKITYNGSLRNKKKKSFLSRIIKSIFKP